MVFRTVLSPISVENKISLSSATAFMGSCFSNNIGDQLRERHFKVMINPFGTVYNPISIVRQFEYALLEKVVNEEEVVKTNYGFVHHDFHSQFTHPDKAMVIQNINHALEETRNFLHSCDHIFITLGTCWVYVLKESQNVVANCHKRPADVFFKKMLSLEELKLAILKLNELVKTVQPKIHVVYTISPVRHIKDGLVENSLSKAQLRVALSEAGISGKAYFPAYEYMMDDLRDYRFYDDDLIHPSRFAIQYLWEQFVSGYFDSQTIQKIERIDKINKFLHHRPHLINETYIQTKKSMLDELNSILGTKISP